MHIHVLEVGRAPAIPARLEAESLDAAACYIARRTGREDALTLARIAWNGGSVQVGMLTVRGWSRSDQGRSCPHCGQQVYARAVTCAEEAEQAGLAEGHRPDTAWASLELVFPAAACEFCGENLVFVGTASRQGG